MSSSLIPGIARFGPVTAHHPLLELAPAHELATGAARTIAWASDGHATLRPAAVAELRRQLREAGAPSHGSILGVRGVGVHEDRLWALLDPVASTLGEAVAAAPLGLEPALDHAFAVLGAVVSLHAAGRTHGSISPESVYCRPDGGVALAPYSWLAAGPAPDFRSPESALGAPAGQRSDLYELGALLFWLLTGRSPRELFQEPAGSLRFRGVPEGLVEVICRATRFDPTMRYRSAVMMAADLQREADRLLPGHDRSALGSAFGPRPPLPTRAPPLAALPPPDAAARPALPPDELDRLATLVSLAVLDTETEERFDRHTRLAQRLLGTPMALVSLVDADRQWFKSHQGLEARETPRELAFCAHAILSPSKLFEVHDAAEDPRFRENPLVTGAPHIRFYAGQPLQVQGRAVGTLCVIGDAPRRLTEVERAVLAQLAEAVEDELLLEDLEDIDLETGMSNLEGFARHAHLAIGWRAREGKSLRLVHITAPPTVPAQLFAAALVRSHRDADALARLDDDTYCALFPAEVDAAERIAELQAQLPMAAAARLGWVGVTVDPSDETVLAALVAQAETLSAARPQAAAG
jgi:hypothetical protein